MHDINLTRYTLKNTGSNCLTDFQQQCLDYVASQPPTPFVWLQDAGKPRLLEKHYQHDNRKCMLESKFVYEDHINPRPDWKMPHTWSRRRRIRHKKLAPMRDKACMAMIRRWTRKICQACAPGSSERFKSHVEPT